MEENFHEIQQKWTGRHVFDAQTVLSTYLFLSLSHTHTHTHTHTHRHSFNPCFITLIVGIGYELVIGCDRG